MEIVKNTVFNATYFGERATVLTAHLDKRPTGLLIHAVVFKTGDKLVKVSLMTGDGRQGNHVIYETRQCGMSQVEETIATMAAEAGDIIQKALESGRVKV